jgi:hypothetical protein
VLVSPPVILYNIMPPSTLPDAETSVQHQTVTLTARCVQMVFLFVSCVTAGLLVAECGVVEVWNAVLEKTPDRRHLTASDHMTLGWLDHGCT